MNLGVRHALSLLAIVGLVSIGCAATNTAPAVSPEMHEKNVASFERAWEVVNRTYWDPTFGGIDWQAVHDELRPKVEASRTMEDARAVMRDMIDRLGQSHFGILPAELSEDFDPRRGTMAGVTGMEVRVVDGHALVTAIDPGSPAERAGVRGGWEIVSIDGIDVVTKLSELASEIDESPMKRAILSLGVLMKLRGSIGEPVAVEFLDGDDTRLRLEIPRAEERGEVAALGALPGVKVHIDVDRIDGSIGYIAFNAFIDPNYVMKTYNEAMTSFLDADGVIVDLRGNGGGLGAMMTGMAGWFVSERRNAGRIMMRGTDLKLLVEPRATHYDGPVVVIVDHLCGSAAEAFPGILQEIGRAEIVGERTMGAVLGAAFEPLPNGDQLMYAALNFETNTRGSLEGVGVVPDIEIANTRESLLAGRDLPLDAAVAWIREQHEAVTNERRMR